MTLYVTYTPEFGDKQEWEFNPGRVRASQQVMVEKRAGTSWMEWLNAVKAGPGPARRVLVWFLILREHSGVRWEDVDPFDDEVLVELSVAELEKNRDSYLKGGGASNANHDLVMGMFDSQIAEAQAKFGGDGESGKAPSKTEQAFTSG